MIPTMIIGALIAFDSPRQSIKGQYGIDVSRYTAEQQKWLFRPMNRDGTIEPIVLITRANALDWEIYLDSKKSK